MLLQNGQIFSRFRFLLITTQRCHIGTHLLSNKFLQVQYNQLESIQQANHFLKLCSNYCFLRTFCSNSSNTKSTQTASSSVWKSSKTKPITTKDGNIEGSKKPLNYRDILYKNIVLENDFNHIKEEVPLYDIGSTTLYKAVFMLIVIQYCFWVICANILYNFYMGYDSNGIKIINLISSKIKSQSEEQTSGFLKRIQDFISPILKSTHTQMVFIVLGHIMTLIFLFIMQRCVSFIRLMPGGKEVKLGTLNIFGMVKPNRYRIYNLNDLSSIEHRSQKVNYLSLVARDRKVNYFIDRNGNFLNERLFDQTVGMSRLIKKSK